MAWTLYFPHEFPVDIPFVAPAPQAGGVLLCARSRRPPLPPFVHVNRSTSAPRTAGAAHWQPDLRIDNEPLPRPPDVLPQSAGQVRRRAWHYHRRVARLGRRLSQAVVGRQDRPLYPWRELHRFLFLENLRQGRD